MFATLAAIFMKGFSFSKMAKYTSIIADLIEIFEEEYGQDQDAKNAAIDTVIQILQTHKNNTQVKQ